MVTKYAKVMTYGDWLPPIIHINLENPGHGRSREKLEILLYLYYHNIYNQSTCQAGSKPRGAPTHKFA